jgi:serine/threonine protein kinase
MLSAQADGGSMKIKVEKMLSIPLDIDTITPLHSGGEGSIYAVPDVMLNYLLKIYHDQVLSRPRQEKVLDLCSRYDTFAPLFKPTQYAFPQKSAQNHDNEEIVGFAMANMGDLPKLDMIGFGDEDFKEADGHRLTDKTALELIYKLYESLSTLHTSNIVLGDLNPSNILYNFKLNEPVFIDLDAAQIGKHSCPAVSYDYLDPLVESSARNADNTLKYSQNSDYYALAVIAYELFIGASPFAFRSNPPLDIEERKRLNESLMCYAEDPGFAASTGRHLIENNRQNELRLTRLRLLKSQDKVLFRYLFETFTVGKRDNLLRLLPRNDPRNPRYIFASKNRIKTIADTLAERKPTETHSAFDGGKVIDKEEANRTIAILRKYYSDRQLRRTTYGADPLSFTLFVNNLGLNYNDLVSKGTGHA